MGEAAEQQALSPDRMYVLKYARVPTVLVSESIWLILGVK
jgi:hypothetical protein